MENEEKFSNELSNSQNFIADSNQVSSFVKSFLQKDSKRYSRLFQMCAGESRFIVIKSLQLLAEGIIFIFNSLTGVHGF